MIHRCHDVRLAFGECPEAGNTIIESTLAYTAFLMLLIGTIDLGQVLFLHQSIAERVREAVRYGTSRRATADTETAMKNIVLYNTPAPAENTTASFGLKPENVAVVRTPGTLENPSRLTVKVSAVTFRFLTPFAAMTRRARTISATLPMEAE